MRGLASIARFRMVKKWFPQNTFFSWFFTGRAFIMVYYIIKLDLEFQLDLQNPLKQPNMWIFFSNPPKMALFGLNWEESKWPGHFCPAVPTFFASKIGVKLPPEKKVPWHRRWAALGRGSNCHFCQKKCIFRTENDIFSKSSFSTKMFSDPKYSFSVCQKYFFAVSKKVSIFHHS